MTFCTLLSPSEVCDVFSVIVFDIHKSQHLHKLLLRREKYVQAGGEGEEDLCCQERRCYILQQGLLQTLLNKYFAQQCTYGSAMFSLTSGNPEENGSGDHENDLISKSTH